MDVRCCCNADNLMGELPEGLPYPIRELDDGTFAYIAHSLPEGVRAVLEEMPHKRGKRKTWRNKK